MRNARMPRSGALAAVIALAVALSACAAADADDDPPPSGEPVPVPPGVRVEFAQLRSDVAARQAQVRVGNDTDAPVRIGDVAVVDARFDGPAERVVAGRTSTVPPGGSTDIRIQLPAMACDGAGAADDAGMTVMLELDGSPRVAPLPDVLDVIPPLYERECLAARVADAAALSWESFEPSPPGEPAALRLAIAPTGRAAVGVDGIQTTNLLTFSAAAGDTVDTFPVGLEVGASDSGRVVVELPLVPLRCDPHAVQEDKRGTVFTVEVIVEGEPGQIELAAPEDMRGRILTWVGQWCGFGS